LCSRTAENLNVEPGWVSRLMREEHGNLERPKRREAFLRWFP